MALQNTANHAETKAMATSLKSQDSPPAKRTFLTLPIEVRLLIYHFVFANSVIAIFNDTNYQCKPSKDDPITREIRGRGYAIQISHNGLLGLPWVCRAIHDESLRVAINLTRINIAKFILQALDKVDPFIPRKWMRHIRYLKLSGFPSAQELLTIPAKFPSLRLLEMSDFERDWTKELIQLHELRKISDEQLLSILCGKPYFFGLGFLAPVGSPRSPQGPEVIKQLGHVELRTSTALCVWAPGLKVICYKASFNSKEGWVTFKHWDRSFGRVHGMSKEEFDNGNFAIAPRQIVV